MPKADSLKSILDTVQKSSQDSLFMPDSVSVSDSIHTPTTQIIKFNGFEGIMHPSLPATENWVFITLLLLLAISALMFVRSSGWVIESMRTFFTVKDRGSIFYKRTMSDFESRLFLVIFSIGVFSLYSYLIINPSGENFSVITFFKFLGITTGFFVLKYLIIKIIAYVFLHPTVQKQTTESYYNVLIYLGLVLFPLLIFQIYFLEDLKHYVKIASLILCLGASIVYTTKLFLIFFKNFATSFYLLLYLCTLEILPIVLLFYLYNFMI